MAGSGLKRCGDNSKGTGMFGNFGWALAIVLVSIYLAAFFAGERG